jgi:molecular chaperone GrpE
MAAKARKDSEEPGIDPIEQLTGELAEAKEQAEGYLASWQRTQADFVNYKRRAEQDREEIGKFGNVQLLQTILPALDDLERALESIPEETADDSWVEGIRLIERKLRAGLELQGVRPIAAIGEAFDPNLHQAALHTNGEEGIVLQEFQKGYVLHDRVIRPSMVVVGNGEEETDSGEEDAA